MFWLVSGLFLAVGPLAADPARPEDVEAGFVGRIGDERAAAGLVGYVVAQDLVDVARRQAAEMQRQQRLHHNPRLGDDVQGWQSVGENVGVGPAVEDIHRKFMESQSHRDNILSDRFTEIGVGVVVDGPDVWVVQVFRLPRAAAGPAPAPAASSEPPPASAEPAPPEPRPAPAPSPVTGGAATVRAASTGAGSLDTTSTSAAPTTSVAPATTVATLAVEVPTSMVEAPSSTPDATPTADVVDGTTPTAPSGAGTVVDLDLRSWADRQVTWPVGLAATLLVGVVAALAVHVGSATVRSFAAGGRRTSLLDVWELALAG